jgi:hypothetical protein
MVLTQLGLTQAARQALVQLARVNALDDWRFTEWLHGQTLAPMGMAGQSWNAATFLLALRGLEAVSKPAAPAGGQLDLATAALGAPD